MNKKLRKYNLSNAEFLLENGIDVEKRTIYISGEINFKTSDLVLRGISILTSKNLEPINIFINTFGGCPYSAFSIYDCITTQKDIIIKTFNIGACMSAGTIIFMAGDERFAYENSVFMFHTVSGGIEGKNMEVLDEAVELKNIYKQMCDIYGINGKLSAKDWHKKLLHRDVYLRSHELDKLGILTKIIKSN